MLVESLKIGKASMDVRITNHQNQKIINKCKKLSLRIRKIAKRKINLVVIFMVMMVTFIVSFLPYAIGRFLYDTGTLSSIRSEDSFILLSVCHIGYKGSSIFHPFFTLYMKEDYRITLTRSMRRKGMGHFNRLRRRKSDF